MIKYEFLYNGQSQKFVEGTSFDDCVTKFSQWVSENRKSIKSIDQEAEQYDGDKQLSPRKFIKLPLDGILGEYV